MRITRGCDLNCEGAFVKCHAQGHRRMHSGICSVITFFSFLVLRDFFGVFGIRHHGAELSRARLCSICRCGSVGWQSRLRARHRGRSHCFREAAR